MLNSSLLRLSCDAQTRGWNFPYSNFMFIKSSYLLQMGTLGYMYIWFIPFFNRCLKVCIHRVQTLFCIGFSYGSSTYLSHRIMYSGLCMKMFFQEKNDETIFSLSYLDQGTRWCSRLVGVKLRFFYSLLSTLFLAF